ncbi:hypothetical protein [Xanthobacter sediminis]|uniref:hypothetical protein n=1 Tax=Xanthobacter sediminis TaxID=3119926 RepID=UPI0037294560
MRRSLSKLALALALLAAPAAASLPARADDIADAIAEAQKAYAAGNLSDARQALDVASQLLAQRNAEGLAKFLPPAPAGWTAGQVETDAAAVAMFGGGLIAKREYTRGKEQVSVRIIAQSPIVAQMSAMFSNAQILGMTGKLFRIDGRTAVITRDGTVQFVGGGSLVMIEGNAGEAEKRAFLSAIDLAALEKSGG